MKKILAYCLVALLFAPLQMVSAQDVHPPASVRGLPECAETRAIFEAVMTTAKEFVASQHIVQGQIKIPFILVDFPDLPMTRSKADFEQLFNALNLTETPDGPVPGSLRDYFLETSFGQLDLTVSLYGPFRMPEPVATYEWTPPAWGGHSASADNPIRMVREAIRQATSEELGDARLYLPDYDFVGEGFMQHLHVIFAGHGVGSGGIVGQHINPHATRGGRNWNLATVDGIRLHGYSVSAEFLHIDRGIALGDIGTVAHELGHSLFDLPDLYGVPGSLDWWCVMAIGTGQRPSHFSAWSRMRIGWVEPIVLDSPQVVTLPNPATATEDVVFRINTATPNEFFLIENRQQHGFDKSIPASGLVIYHVDDATTGCVMCNPNRRRVYVKQAGGGLHSLNADRTTDTWPQWGRTSFTDYTAPNSHSWAGEPTNKPIHNITQHADGSITFRFMMEPEIPDYYSVNFALVAPTVVHGSSERNVGVRFYNLGQPITDAVIEWSIDGVAQEPYTWSGNLNFETEMTVQLGTFYFTNATHEISVRVVIADADIDETLTQTTQVTRPIFFEDFEGDVSGWQIANGPTVNRWMIGDNVAAEGNWSAFISNDSLTNQSNEAITTRFIHIFHQIAFPQSDEDFELYFDVRGTGTLEVRTTGLFNPVGGSSPGALPQARLLGRVGDVANWETVNYTLPAERYAGQTFNLIFTWDMGGVQPPKAIDNIAIVGPTLPPQIVTFGTLPLTTIDTEFTTVLIAVGTLPIAWEITDGALPEGLDFCTTTGLISGTPTVGGIATFTARATNDYGSEDRVFTLNVRMPPAITTETLADGTVGEPYSQTLTATGTTPITWLRTSGDLPGGLTLAAGVISGTPTTAGDFTFTVRAANILGATHHAFREFTITIADTATTPDPDPDPDTIPSSIIDVERLETLVVFPNPITDKLHIVIPNPSTTLRVNSTRDLIEIFDINGRLVFSQPVETGHAPSLHNGTMVIDISHLPNGPYIVRFGQSYTRIIKR